MSRTATPRSALPSARRGARRTSGASTPCGDAEHERIVAGGWSKRECRQATTGSESSSSWTGNLLYPRKIYRRLAFWIDRNTDHFLSPLRSPCAPSERVCWRRYGIPLASRPRLAVTIARTGGAERTGRACAGYDRQRSSCLLIAA